MANETTQQPVNETNEDISPSYKKLYRLPKSGKIAGVCAGLADYLELDVTLIRIVFVVLTLASGGFGVFAYIILALVIPADEGRVLATDTHATNLKEDINNLSDEMRGSENVDRLKNMIGIGLVIFGAWLLLVQFFPQWLSLNWSIVWPAVLIVLGLMFVAKSRR